MAQLLRRLGIMGPAPPTAMARAFQHYLLHTGGRGVLDVFESKLGLTPEQVAPSRAALHRFGNTSAASTWCAWGNPNFSRCAPLRCPLGFPLVTGGHCCPASCSSSHIPVPCSREGMAWESYYLIDTVNDIVVRCRYILANIEQERSVRKGDRLWQVGFGGGGSATLLYVQIQFEIWSECIGINERRSCVQSGAQCNWQAGALDSPTRNCESCLGPC